MRVDDPKLVLEASAMRERNNRTAVRTGLPAVGSRLVNRYGLKFVVESHVHVPTANTIQSWRTNGPTDADLFPSIIPQNLSEKLTQFIATVDRCTVKTLLVLDTMPHLRRNSGVPEGHWIDTVGNEGANLLFIDAAHIHETHFAHEIGHLWVQYVDLAEDDRVMKDVSDPTRLNQVSFIQSFVTDLRVNQIISDKGFDVSVVQEDQAASIASLGRAIEAGYRPESKREGVFMALALAAQILEERSTRTDAVSKLDDTLEKVTGVDPELARLATGFAEAVLQNGYESKDQIRASIDECLEISFAYTGEGIDLDQELFVPPLPEPEFDKYPDWFEGASPLMKCEIGRIMARENIPDGCTWSITDTHLLSFKLPDGTLRGQWPLENARSWNGPANFQRINEINQQNRERQMNNRPANDIPNLPGQARRFYMAGTARFLTRVREAEWIGGEPPYLYAMNNPLTYSDPGGLSPDPCAPGGSNKNHPPDCSKCGPSCKAVWLTRYKGAPNRLAVYCNPDDKCSDTVNGKRCLLPCKDVCKRYGGQLGDPVWKRGTVVCIYGIHGPQEKKINDCGCGPRSDAKPNPDSWMDYGVSDGSDFKDGWRCVCSGHCRKK